MACRLLVFIALVLVSCNSSGNKIQLENTIQFQKIAQIDAPETMKLFDERKGQSPYQIYFTENKDLELQFRHLNNFAGEMPRLKGIYDKNASDNGIQILESSFRQINDHSFLVQRTEGVNDNVDYHSIQLATIKGNKIVQCLIRTLTKDKEKWMETMEAMTETLQLN